MTNTEKSTSDAKRSLGQMWADADERAARRARQPTSKAAKAALYPFHAVVAGLTDNRYWYMRDMAILAVGSWVLALISVGNVVLSGDWSWALYCVGFTALGLLVALFIGVLVDRAGPE